MRKGFLPALLAAVSIGGGYFYYVAESVCPAPISYSLGTIDGKFNLSPDQARLAIKEAESVWEDATGRDLFTYKDKGDLSVNFVFDERQAYVNAEGNLKQKLDATQSVSDSIKSTYTSLTEEYGKLKSEYGEKVAAYEQKLEEYNSEVEKYNKQGGAPSDVFDALSEKKNELNSEQVELDALSEKLNDLVKQINNVGETGNSIINTSNQGVVAYNKTFGEPREFTQGDYTNNVIKIYSYENLNELKLVLVHELGHALGLDHVENKESAMYYLIGDQPETAALTAEDLQEFNRVCGETNILKRIQLALQRNH